MCIWMTLPLSVYADVTPACYTHNCPRLQLWLYMTLVVFGAI